MPKYQYRCQDCECDFEVRHSMFYKDQACIKCDSKKVFKVPSLLGTHASNHFSKKRTGAVVDNYISDVKKELASEKRDLKKREL